MTTEKFDFRIFDEGDSVPKFSDLYEPIKIIGNGSFAKVVAVRQKSNHQEYAIKIIDKGSLVKEEYGSFVQEAGILGQLSHPHIVKMIKIVETTTKIFLVMEWLKGGTLSDLIIKRRLEKTGISDDEASLIMKSLLSAVQYIHSKDIIHRDIKPENILLGEEDNLSTVKLVDFGLSAQYDSEAVSKQTFFESQCGTRAYMAPELWEGKRYSKPVDIWSCGLIMYMIIGGKHPLYELTDSPDVYQKKLENTEWKFSENFSENAKSLFIRLTRHESKDRFIADEALTHPWITRSNEGPFPLTVTEKLRAMTKAATLARMIKLFYMMTYRAPAKKKIIDQEYKNQTNAISDNRAPKYQPPKIVNLGLFVQTLKGNLKGTDGSPTNATPKIRGLKIAKIQTGWSDKKMIDKLDSSPYNLKNRNTPGGGTPKILSPFLKSLKKSKTEIFGANNPSRFKDAVSTNEPPTPVEKKSSIPIKIALSNNDERQLAKKNTYGSFGDHTPLNEEHSNIISTPRVEKAVDSKGELLTELLSTNTNPSPNLAYQRPSLSSSITPAKHEPVLNRRYLTKAKTGSMSKYKASEYPKRPLDLEIPEPKFSNGSSVFSIPSLREKKAVQSDKTSLPPLPKQRVKLPEVGAGVFSPKFENNKKFNFIDKLPPRSPVKHFNMNSLNKIHTEPSEIEKIDLNFESHRAANHNIAAINLKSPKKTIVILSPHPKNSNKSDHASPDNLTKNFHIRSPIYKEETKASYIVRKHIKV